MLVSAFWLTPRMIPLRLASIRSGGAECARWRCRGPIGGAAIEDATEWGKRRLLSDVGDENRRAAAVYERHGFALSGRVSTLPAPRQHIKASEMELMLGGG